MNRTTPIAAMMLAALSLSVALPGATANEQPIVWEGFVQYDVAEDGSFQNVIASPGCRLEHGFRSDLFSRETDASFGEGSTVTCIPDVPTELTISRVPTCTATLLAAFKPVVAGYMIGSVSCYGRNGGATNYCVGTTATPCSASVTFTPADSPRCSLAANGVTVRPPGGITVRCTTKVVYV